MNQPAIAAKLQQFADAVTAAIDSNPDEANLHPQVAEHMRTLVREDDWLDPAFTQPHPEYYQQYLLYADPRDRFSVVSFVWGPGQQTPIHDHTVWGVIGMLRGREHEQCFTIDADGTPVPTGDEATLLPGDIGLVSPTIGDVHRVSNALDDQVSISIHAYGGNIGKIKRHVFPAEGGPAKEFISGYSNPAN